MRLFDFDTATVESKKARQLERVQKIFEEAYRQDAKKPTGEGETRYSISEIVDASGKHYGIGVHLDSTLLDNLTPDERKAMVRERIKELGGEAFTAYDSNGNAVEITIAKPSASFRNQSGKRRPVNHDLTTKHIGNEVKQEAVVLIDELITTSKFQGTAPANHAHGWLDNNGQNNWDAWTTYLQDKNNTIWEATLHIANTANGEKIIYDVDPIKRVGQSGKSDTSLRDASVPQKGAEVNTQNSLSEQDADDIAPLPWQIRGKDVALDDVAPPIVGATKNATTTAGLSADDITPVAGENADGVDETRGIRDQIRGEQDKLNKMPVVAQIQVPAEYTQMDIAGKKNWVVEKLRSTGYKVERKGFGVIDFAKKRLKSAFNYFDKNSVEETAFEALPYVLENGIEISGHNNHKDRNYETVTIAAPITINGKRGNMAVVVKRSDGNYYKVHRILTPDGSVFVLPDKTSEAESTPAGGVAENGSLATPKDSASVNSIPENGGIVNGDIPTEEWREASESLTDVPAGRKPRPERLVVKAETVCGVAV